MNATRSYRPIADYGVVGDLYTAYLIASDGSIDWACLPFFDSPAVFLRLLDCRNGGYCTFGIANLIGTSRRYIEGTNILETTFTSDSGSLVITDFMPVLPSGDPADRCCRIIRLVRCTAGQVHFDFDCKPTFAFNSAAAHSQRLSSGAFRFEAQGQSLVIEGPGLRVRREGHVAATIRAAAGEVLFFALSCVSPGSQVDPLDLSVVQSALDETNRYWMGWSGRLHYEGNYRDEILRSMLLLKLLTFAPTGAIVAAPTTSLPEIIGGSRNWDYRLSWIRDSQFVLTALMHGGYLEEAHEFFRFLKRAACRPGDQLQVLYDIHGERAGAEMELQGVEGYRCSRPVRIGNAAGFQKQSDIYGELLNCIYVYCHMTSSETEKGRRALETWPLARSLADHVVRHWREPDRGIWEWRESARQFVHSKAMCWTALDRAIKLASVAGATVDVASWQLERDAIFDSIGAHGFNTNIGAFVQSYGSEVLDAAVLRLPLQGVIPADDARMVSTIEQIEHRLLQNGLVMRYRGHAHTREEGAFTSCTLWLIDNYVLLDRREQAREVLAHLLSFRSDLGLYSEEINPETGEQLGNFPQALTHVALISSIRHLEGSSQPGALHVSG